LFFALLEAEGVVSCFQDIAVMSDAIEECGGHFSIPEHLIIPLILIVESLKFLLLTPITRFLGPFYGWQTGLLAVGRLWLWSFFRMAENDRCPSL
jgi:hypothetical protein